MFARGKLQNLSILESRYLIKEYGYGFFMDFILYLENLNITKLKYDKLRYAECFYFAKAGTDSKEGHKAYIKWVKEQMPKEESNVPQETLFQKAKRLRGN